MDYAGDVYKRQVLTGEAGNDKKYDVKPDLVCKDLLDAVEKILQVD